MKKPTSNHRRIAVFLVLLLLFTTGLSVGHAQEATENPAPTPEATQPVTEIPATQPPEQTAEPGTATPLPEVTSEATEPVPTATPLPEVTSEATEPPPTATPLPEVTSEATEQPAPTDTPAASPFTVEPICLETGPAFVITNTGPDMTEPAFYTLEGVEPVLPETTPEPSDEVPADLPTDVPVEQPTEVPAEQPTDAPAEQPADAPVDEPAADVIETPTPEPEVDAPPSVEVGFMLAAGESLTVSGGTSLRIGEDVYAADPECQATPVLTVTAVCEFETGVAFTIENSGGPMSAELPYTISAIDPELTGVFQLGANESISIEAGYGSPVFTSGELTSTLDEPCYEPATITGVIWDDLDLDGARGEIEPGLANITVTLTDPAGFALSAVTAEDGSYSFEMLPAATYIVGVDTTTLPPDYVLTAPADAAEAAVTLDVILDLDYTADFGFAAQPTASISGTVWLETGNFGVRDGSEMGVNGAMVELLDETGTLIASVPVDAATGAYSFAELFSGDYTVRLAQATLFTPIGVTWDFDGDLNFETAITLEAGQALVGADFGIAGTF